MDTIDLVKDQKVLYRPPTHPVLVDVPEMSFLMIDGRGDPNSTPAYREALEALFSVAYTVKFALKRGGGVDIHVAPLESLWWSPGGSLLDVPKADWRWTAMMALPDLVTEEMVEEAGASVTERRAVPALPRMRFERFHEGLSAQVMHVGPYAAEGPTIETLFAFIAETGHVPHGKHHEIYLGDPRRSAPERLRTVIRQPIARRTVEEGLP